MELGDAKSKFCVPLRSRFHCIVPDHREALDKDEVIKAGMPLPGDLRSAWGCKVQVSWATMPRMIVFLLCVCFFCVRFLNKWDKNY